MICFQQTIFDNLICIHESGSWICDCFQQTSLTTILCKQIPFLIVIDLLSTNDLWQHKSILKDGLTVVICFQQTIFDNNIHNFTALRHVVICFQQTIFDNRALVDLYFPIRCDLLSTNDLWQRKGRSLNCRVVILLSTNDLWQQTHTEHKPKTGCDLLSTNDLWQQPSQKMKKPNKLWFAFNKRSLTTYWCIGLSAFRLWFAFNKRSLTTRHRYSYQRLPLWFYFQQTIFDNYRRWQNHLHHVVICFQQTIFDNFVIKQQRLMSCDLLNKRSLTTYYSAKTITVVICFQQNDLWQLNHTVIGLLVGLWFAFNKRSLTTLWSWGRSDNKLWFAFNKRLWQQITVVELWVIVVICFPTNDLWQPSSTNTLIFKGCDLLSTNDLWQPNIAQVVEEISCDLLSTNDLWQQYGNRMWE